MGTPEGIDGALQNVAEFISDGQHNIGAGVYHSESAMETVSQALAVYRSIAMTLP